MQTWGVRRDRLSGGCGCELLCTEDTVAEGQVRLGTVAEAGARGQMLLSVAAVP